MNYCKIYYLPIGRHIILNEQCPVTLSCSEPKIYDFTAFIIIIIIF